MDKAALGQSIAGAVRSLATTPGAAAQLTFLAQNTRIAEHVHDNPYLSLYLLGGYCETGEAGVMQVEGPAAAFHPRGSCHSDAIGDHGLATIVIEFEAAWLRRAFGIFGVPDRPTYWLSGPGASAASKLTRRLVRDRRPCDLTDLVVRFLSVVLKNEDRQICPDWWARAAVAVRDESLAVEGIARSAGVAPEWLCRTYRAAAGEGIADTRRRLRVEKAIAAVQRSDAPLAEIAAANGFCDQSHMNRCFVTMMGLTPGELRNLLLL